MIVRWKATAAIAATPPLLQREKLRLAVHRPLARDRIAEADLTPETTILR